MRIHADMEPRFVKSPGRSAPHFAANTPTRCSRGASGRRSAWSTTVSQADIRGLTTS
jgi:hypothetical protein